MFIGTLMIVDGVFSLINHKFVKEYMFKNMPMDINIYKIAFSELIFGLGIVISGIYAQVKC